jgi:hypothetical protein
MFANAIIGHLNFERPSVHGFSDKMIWHRPSTTHHVCNLELHNLSEQSVFDAWAVNFTVNIQAGRGGGGQ